MGNQPSSDHEVRPMRHSPDAEVKPHPADTQVTQHIEPLDAPWQAEEAEHAPLESRRDATFEAEDPPQSRTARLEAIYTRRLGRLQDAQSANASQRMELHHQVNTLGHNIVHVQDSAEEIMKIVAGTKISSKDGRRQLKDARAMLQSDIAAVAAQQQSVTSLMAELRDSDLKLDDACHGLQQVSEVALDQLHQASFTNDDTTGELSIASTPMREDDETRQNEEQFPEQLQGYYDSAIQVRFMQERLDELLTEQMEQLTRRDLTVDQDGSLDQTDEEFNQMWDEELSVARKNLDEALAALQVALTACEDAGITVPAWNPESPPTHDESFASVLQDDEQLSILTREPLLPDSDSALSTFSKDNTGAKHKVEQWVVNVKPSLGAALPLHHNTSTFAFSSPSEPGVPVSGYWKVNSIRAVNSDEYLRQTSSLSDKVEQHSLGDVLPGQEHQTSTISSPDATLTSATSPRDVSLPFVGQNTTILEQSLDDLPMRFQAGRQGGLFATFSSPRVEASIGKLKKASTIDSGYGSSIVTTSKTKMRVADAEFQKQSDPILFFSCGKVFSTLWTPPGDRNQRGRSKAADLSVMALNGYASSRIRHFVVIRQREGFCNALEISAHSGNGDPQWRKYNHGFVYTNLGSQRPNSEANDIQRSGIQINPYSSSRALHPTSSVNYARVYNIDHELRVKPYGTVDGRSLDILLRQWKQVSLQIYRRDPEVLARAVRQPSARSLDALDFTPTQVKSILKAINDGLEPWSAIVKVAKNSATEHLGETLAEMVSSFMLEGLGYSAAVSRARHHGVRPGSSEEVGFDQTQEGAKYDDDLDVDDAIGADDDPGLDGGRLLA